MEEKAFVITIPFSTPSSPPLYHRKPVVVLAGDREKAMRLIRRLPRFKVAANNTVFYNAAQRGSARYVACCLTEAELLKAT